MLALYNFARGRAQEAWDFCGAGLRALSALKLNTEEGINELVGVSTEADYGFSRQTLQECCRRTFWSGFLMDVSYKAPTADISNLMMKQRYNGFCGGTLSVINLEDTFVNLPCPETMYEASTPCEAPLFDYALLSQRSNEGQTLGHMAQLILISALWGEVLTFTSRAIHRPDTGYERAYEIFYAQTYERLNNWLSMLPSNLQYTPLNLDQSIVEGYSGIFISLHALYQATVIRLNRHIRIHAVLPEKVRRNIGRSFHAASSFMAIIHSLTAINCQGRLASHPASRFLFSTPFPGYALMLSVDVITSAGTVPALPACIETIGSTLSFIETMGGFWASAGAQQRAISERLQQLGEIKRLEEQGIHNGSYGQFWRVPESLESAFGENDAVYKSSDQLVFETVGELA
jgi:hypothetical protein